MNEIEEKLYKKKNKKKEPKRYLADFFRDLYPVDGGGGLMDIGMINGKPIYAMQEGATMDGILHRVDENMEKENFRDTLFRVDEEGGLKPAIGRDLRISKEQLHKQPNGFTNKEFIVPAILTSADRRYNLVDNIGQIKGVPPMQIFENLSNPTPIKEIEKPQPATEPEQSGEKLTRLDEGVSAAIDQVRLSWEYMIKNVQKMLTRDEKKLRSLDEDIERIGQEYDSIPEMKGAAQIGSIGVNVVGVALPTIIAGALASPGAAAVVGGGLASIDMATSASRANMEIDSYERTTGEDVSQEDRAAYVSATLATDAIMNVLLGSKVLKGLSPKMSNALSGELKEAILKSPVAQQEFNTMTRQVIKNEMQQLPQEIGKEAVKSGIVGGVSSGMMEAEKGIYTGQAPELESIVTSVLGGFASGMMQGAITGATTPMRKHQQRMDKNDVYYVSQMNNRAENKLPISEIDIESMETDGRKKYVHGEVSPSTGGEPIKGKYDVRNVSGGSYREAHKQGATNDKSDSWDVNSERMEEYSRVWNDAKEASSTDEYYAMRNEVVQSIAADMGVPVTVYSTMDDVPKELIKNGVIGKSGAVTVDNEGIYVVLERCRGLTASNMAAVLRHEAIGHYGLPKLYDSDEAYNKDLEEIGASVFDGEKPYEEEVSLKAERRDQYQGHSENEALERVYDLLRRSEDHYRNSTVSEKRNSQRQRELRYLLRDGWPMPSLYDIERVRKRNGANRQ